MSDDQSKSNPFSASEQQIEPQSYEQDNQNDQFIDRDMPVAQGKDFFQIYGMYFCGTCKNMIQPYSTKGEILQFKCKRCGPLVISFKHRQNKKCMMYSKALQEGTRKTVADAKFIFDQSMPRMTIDCPECDYPEAVYLVTPDQGERKIVVRLICMRGAQFYTVECGNMWDLDENAEVYEDHVKLVGTERSIQEYD